VSGKALAAGVFLIAKEPAASALPLTGMGIRIGNKSDDFSQGGEAELQHQYLTLAPKRRSINKCPISDVE